MKSSIFIPYLLRDGAILLRNQENHFWGYTGSEQEVTLSYEEIILKTKSDEKGYFDFILPAHEVSESIEFKISTVDVEIILKDICFGDVFLLGGQSNMQLWMERLKTRYPDEIERAKNPWIRYFEVPQEPSFDNIKTELTSGQWKRAIGKDLKNLSGIGYFFAKQKYEEDQVPVGIICTTVGGSPINAWLNQEVLRELNLLPDYYTELKNTDYHEKLKKSDERYQENYQKLFEMNDIGVEENWQNSDFNDEDWSRVYLNKSWPQHYQNPGSVWLRKQFNVPTHLIGKKALLNLGTMIDADETFVNGQKVGGIDYQYPPRIYEIENLSEVLTIAIRLKIYQLQGGVTQTKEHIISTEGEIINLDDSEGWKIKRASYFPERKAQYFPQYEPTGLFNGMISPLSKLKISGIFWYQGESDSHEYSSYGMKFSKLIQEWREIFNNQKIPFIFVQLPNCSEKFGGKHWAELREEQAKSLNLNYTGMVVSIGDGESDDLHPTNKKVISEKIYQCYKQINNGHIWGYCSGPRATKVNQVGNNLFVSFQTYGKKLKLRNHVFLEVFRNGRIEKLSNVELIGNQIKIILPAGLELIGSDITYNWSNNPQVLITDDIDHAAAPFKLKIS